MHDYRGEQHLAPRRDHPGPRHRRARGTERDLFSTIQREFFSDNLLIRIEMIWWTGLTPWETILALGIGVPAAAHTQI